MWAEIPHPPLHHGAFKPLNYCSWATYAKLMEDSGQLYGNMAGYYRGRYDQGGRVHPHVLFEGIKRIWVI